MPYDSADVGRDEDLTERRKRSRRRFRLGGRRLIDTFFKRERRKRPRPAG